jgi:hypothetical protein
MSHNPLEMPGPFKIIATVIREKIPTQLQQSTMEHMVIHIGNWYNTYESIRQSPRAAQTNQRPWSEYVIRVEKVMNIPDVLPLSPSSTSGLSIRFFLLQSILFSSHSIPLVFSSSLISYGLTDSHWHQCASLTLPSSGQLFS